VLQALTTLQNDPSLRPSQGVDSAGGPLLAKGPFAPSAYTGGEDSFLPRLVHRGRRLFTGACSAPTDGPAGGEDWLTDPSPAAPITKRTLGMSSSLLMYVTARAGRGDVADTGSAASTSGLPQDRFFGGC
jgi:hypothetical protein